MKNNISNVLGWAKAHPVATAVLVALFAPGFLFGAVFSVLGFIGVGRIFFALVILGGWSAYRYAKSQASAYKETAKSTVSLARELKRDYF